MTDAEKRLGLYVIRALGKAGCRVTALSAKSRGRVIAFSSRYVAERHRLPPGDYPEVLPEAIEGLAPTHDLLMPVSTHSLLMVAERVERLGSALPFYIPTFDAIWLVSDNGATTGRIAQEAGIPVPKTFEDLDSSIISTCAEEMAPKLPLIVNFKDDRRWGGWNLAERYSIVRSPSELVAAYSCMCEAGGQALVQEYVEGDGCGFFTLMDPSREPVANFCHRRLREYPISGGGQHPLRKLLRRETRRARDSTSPGHGVARRSDAGIQTGSEDR